MLKLQITYDGYEVGEEYQVIMPDGDWILEELTWVFYDKDGYVLEKLYAYNKLEFDYYAEDIKHGEVEKIVAECTINTDYERIYESTYFEPAHIVANTESLNLEAFVVETWREKDYDTSNSRA